MNIFVFGSNLAGRHGAGAALYALKNHNAKYGVGEGLTGTAYAIPTKDYQINTLPLSAIQAAVARFKHYAAEHPEFTFQVTRIGCGLAGYQDKDIAPMFINASSNCILPRAWKLYYPEPRYWDS